MVVEAHRKVEDLEQISRSHINQVYDRLDQLADLVIQIESSWEDFDLRLKRLVHVEDSIEKFGTDVASITKRLSGIEGDVEKVRGELLMTEQKLNAI